MSQSTIDIYNYNANQFIEYLEKEHQVTKIEDVSSFRIKQFIQYVLEMGNKPLYINIMVLDI